MDRDRLNLWPAVVASIGAIVVLLSSQITTAAVLWQSNSDGDDIHLFDAESFEPLGRLVVGPNPHGLATDAKQQTVYVTLERNGDDSGELLWVDLATRTIKHRLAVGPEPHQLAVSPNGEWAYVPCRDGHYWVIDTEKREVVKKIKTGGRPHNTSISADDRFAYLSPMGDAARVTVVSIPQGHQVIGEIQFSDSVRPPALTRSGDFLFQHVDGLNGFEAANATERKVVARVTHSTSLGWFLARPKKLGWLGGTGFKRCHGLAIRPDDEEVWSACGNFLGIHGATTPYTERAIIELPSRGYWLTFHPDSSLAYIALSDVNQVAAIDTHSRTIVALIDVGRMPKRNLVLLDPM